MRIKSYFAGTVAEAVEKARRELGSDAMLLNSKRTEAGLRSLGEYEVVFVEPPGSARAVARSLPLSALPSSPRPVTARPPRNTAAGPVIQAPAAAAARNPAPAKPDEPLSDLSRDPSGNLARELDELRRQIETVKLSVSQQRPGADVTPPANATHDFAARLAAAGFSTDISEELAHDSSALSAAGRADGAEAAPWEHLVRPALERRLSLLPSLGILGSAPRVVLLAGPPGVGKTTTLIKLALRYGLRGRLPLQLLSLDTLRVGGWEQLASYARITGLPCEVLHSTAALDQALAGYRNQKLLLIDTAGFSPADVDQTSGLVQWLAAQRARVEVQLVLSAAVQPRINARIAERFSAFGPAKVIFTHLDEVETAGPLLETALRVALPLSFLADGPRVPEDLNEASFERLLEARLPPAAAAAERVASAA